MSENQNAPTTSTPASAPPPGGVSRTALIWIGVGVVVLSFVAAFLGSWLARSVDGDSEAEPTASATPTPTAAPDYEAIVKSVLPAGSAVRAGTGAPQSGKGYEGDVYIDRATADVYLFQDDWVWVGNIRTNAAENLTGEQGPTGTPGAPGEAGAPGTAGTQVLIGEGLPDNAKCVTDGDIYLDVDTGTTPQYYRCETGAWVPVGTTAGAATPSPTPTP